MGRRQQRRARARPRGRASTRMPTESRGSRRRAPLGWGRVRRLSSTERARGTRCWLAQRHLLQRRPRRAEKRQPPPASRRARLPTISGKVLPRSQRAPQRANPSSFPVRSCQPSAGRIDLVMRSRDAWWLCILCSVWRSGGASAPQTPCVAVSRHERTLLRARPRSTPCRVWVCGVRASLAAGPRSLCSVCVACHVHLHGV